MAGLIIFSVIGYEFASRGSVLAGSCPCLEERFFMGFDQSMVAHTPLDRIRGRGSLLRRNIMEDPQMDSWNGDGWHCPDLTP